MANRKPSQLPLLNQESSTQVGNRSEESGISGVDQQPASIQSHPLETVVRPSDVVVSTSNNRDAHAGQLPAYKPLPRLPDDLRVGCPSHPPAYDTLSLRNTEVNEQQRELENQDEHGFYLLQKPISSTQTVACAFMACLCVPVLGWVPLAFACLAAVPGEESALADYNQQKIRKFIVLLSAGCIVIGMIMLTGFLVRCFNSGQCADFFRSWKSWNLVQDKFNSNSTLVH